MKLGFKPHKIVPQNKSNFNITKFNITMSTPISLNPLLCVVLMSSVIVKVGKNKNNFCQS